MDPLIRMSDNQSIIDRRIRFARGVHRHGVLVTLPCLKRFVGITALQTENDLFELSPHRPVDSAPKSHR